MDLSILIPMYNSEAYILKCLDSLVNQGIPEESYEIIIIDDGSIDNSLTLVEEFKKDKSNINLLKQANSGAYTTRNRLLNLARGNYIYCIDADDYLAYDSLKEIFHLAIENNLDIVGFDTLIVRNDDLKIRDDLIKVPQELNVISGNIFLGEYPNHRVEIWWYIFRKDLIIENELYFDDNEFNADVLFTYRLFGLAKRVAYLPIAMHRYFQAPNSIMRNRTVSSKISLIEHMFDMISKLSKEILELSKVDFENKDMVLINMAKRRDHFLFFNLVKMVRYGYSSNEINSCLRQFSSLGAYPIKNFIGTKKYSITYSFLNLIVNQKRFLLLSSKIFRLKNQLRRNPISALSL